MVNGQTVFVIDIPRCPDLCALGVRFGGRFSSLTSQEIGADFADGRLLAISGGERRARLSS